MRTWHGQHTEHILIFPSTEGAGQGFLKCWRGLLECSFGLVRRALEAHRGRLKRNLAVCQTRLLEAVLLARSRRVRSSFTPDLRRV